MAEICPDEWESCTDDTGVIAKQESGNRRLCAPSTNGYSTGGGLTTEIKKTRYTVVLSSFSARSRLSSCIASTGHFNSHEITHH